MNKDLSKNRSALTKKLKRFFGGKSGGRREVTDFVSNLSKTHDVLVFGGLIRDLCLGGVKLFRSDLDLVVRSEDWEQLRERLIERGATVNKFGGLRLQVSRWLIDAWNIEETWAFKAGLVELKSNESLLKTTYFNWDAAFYNISENTLCSNDVYFEDISNKILRVNLEETPNQFGSLIRALRLIVKYQAKTSHTLSSIISRGLFENDNESIITYEKLHFSYPLLSEFYLTLLREESKAAEGAEIYDWLAKEQHQLPIDLENYNLKN